jgi:signal transduction histidine kinase
LLAVPLVGPNRTFGVLVFLRERKVRRNSWKVRLAQAFAAQIAMAIVAARLYETATQNEKELSARVKHLEHLAEMLAHDMKAPGERLEGLAELLVQKYGRQLDDDARRILFLIRDNSKELTERVEMLLELAQVGSLTKVLEAVDPALVINDVLKARALELAENKIDVQTAVAALAVPSHRAYLRQVFDNLISNAIKYSQNNAGRLIKILSRQECGKAFFSVIDNGPGIPLQERDRVFEPFVRLNPSVSKGTGIGLTVAKRIVEWHGGSIWIEDRDTPGCTITFTLPLLGDLSITPAAPGDHVRHGAA